MWSNISIYLETFISDFLWRCSNISFLSITIFIQANKYILWFILLTSIFIFFDLRFSLKSKLIILIMIPVFLFLVQIYEYDNLNLFFKEVYWYTLVLNLSLVLHLCWFHWIYSLFALLRWELVCWIISRLAFIFSLSFFVFILNSFYIFIDDLQNNTKVSLLKKLCFTFKIILLILALVLRFFIIIFARYSDLILGNQKLTKIYWNHLLIFLLYFTFSIFMSYAVLGWSRIVFNWVFIFLLNFFLMFYNYSKLFKKVYPDQFQWSRVLRQFFIEEIEAILWYDLELPQLKILVLEEKLYIKNYYYTYIRCSPQLIFFSFENSNHRFLLNATLKQVWIEVFFTFMPWFDLVWDRLLGPGNYIPIEEEKYYIFFLREFEALEAINQAQKEYHLTDIEVRSILNYYHGTKLYRWYLINQWLVSQNREEIHFKDTNEIKVVEKPWEWKD